MFYLSLCKLRTQLLDNLVHNCTMHLRAYSEKGLLKYPNNSNKSFLQYILHIPIYES